MCGPTPLDVIGQDSCQQPRARRLRVGLKLVSLRTFPARTLHSVQRSSCAASGVASGDRCPSFTMVAAMGVEQGVGVLPGHTIQDVAHWVVHRPPNFTGVSERKWWVRSLSTFPNI